MKPDLLQLKCYKNEAVVKHFCHHHPECSLDEGQELLEDLLAWMWLSNQRKKLGKKTYLFGPLIIMDEMWHVFILHTRDYVDFSMHFFDEYVHHDVEPAGFEHVMDEEELTDFLQDCFNYLDHDWVTRRFSNALANET
jgi:hypothetical protein